MIIQRTSSIFWSHCFMCFINKQNIRFWHTLLFRQCLKKRGNNTYLYLHQRG
jgi:hypothetical protein